MIWLYCSFDEIRRNLRGPGVPLDFVTNRDFGALLGTLGTPCGNQRQKVSDSSTITYRIHLLDESESSEKICNTDGRSEIHVGLSLQNSESISVFIDGIQPLLLSTTFVAEIQKLQLF